MLRFVLCGLMAAWGGPALADALGSLNAFVREARTGSAEFTQTVTSPDGAKRRSSSGTFEFSRPNRFRFSYTKPFEQLIVADGQRLWIFDPDLNQVVSRKQSTALAATPAALKGTDGLARLQRLQVSYGKPIDMSDLHGLPPRDAAQIATERLMAAIYALHAEL